MQNIKKDTATKKICYECGKTIATLFTCTGCQNAFCVEHVVKHQEDLSLQLNLIEQEYDNFQKELNQNSTSHSILDSINKWEQDSIAIIQQSAELARNKFQQMIQFRNDALIQSFTQIIEQIHSAHQENNYSELELSEWTKKLGNLHQEFATPLAVRTVNEDMIPLIKLEKIEPITNLDDVDQELNSTRFDTNTAGPISISEENRLATYIGGVFANYASVRSLNLYSSKTHVLRFRLESKSNKSIYLGIVSESEPSTPRIYKSPSAYGWKFVCCTNNNGKSTVKEKQTFQSGDEIILKIDCDNHRLGFLYERTTINETVEIDLKKCPLPWQVVVTVVGMHDKVRIIH